MKILPPLFKREFRTGKTMGYLIQTKGTSRTIGICFLSFGVISNQGNQGNSFGSETYLKMFFKPEEPEELL